MHYPLSLYLPAFVPLILDSLHLCALAPLDLPDRKDLFLKITVDAFVVRMATVFKRLLKPFRLHYLTSTFSQK